MCITDDITMAGETHAQDTRLSNPCESLLIYHHTIQMYSKGIYLQEQCHLERSR